MTTLETLTNKQIVDLFERHCECRPVDTERESHGHDCDTVYTNACRAALHAPLWSDHRLEARKRVVGWVNENETTLVPSGSESSTKNSPPEGA